MSVSSLLSPETKNENWAALNCYSLNSSYATIGSATIGNLTGRLTSNPGVIVPSGISLVSGTGTLSQTQNIVSSWRSNNSTTVMYYRLDMGLTWDTNVTAPVTGSVSTFVFNVTIPFGANMSYPVGIGDNMPSSSSVQINQSGGQRYPGSCQIVRNNATSFTVYAVIGGDISGSDPSRFLTVGLSVTYQTTP
jgi:hypothetical protein